MGFPIHVFCIRKTVSDVPSRVATIREPSAVYVRTAGDTA